MPQSNTAVSSRVLHEIRRWLTSRWQECVRCLECEQPVLPFDSLCPNCGQANPAKISIRAGVYLIIGVGMVGILAVIWI